MFTPRRIRELETALDGGKLLELRRDWNDVLRGGGLPKFEKVAKQNECILKHACRVSNQLETRFVGRTQLLNKNSEWRNAVIKFAKDPKKCDYKYKFSIYLDIGYLPQDNSNFNFSHYFQTSKSRAEQKFKRKEGEGFLRHPNITGALGAYIAYRTKNGHGADVGIEVVAYASARTFHWWNISHEHAHGQCEERSNQPPHNTIPGNEDYSKTKGECKYGDLGYVGSRTRKYEWVNGPVPKLQDVLKNAYLGIPDDATLVGSADGDTPYINVNPKRTKNQKGGRVLELHVVAADPAEKGIGRFVTLLLLNHFQTKMQDKTKELKFKHVIMEQKIPDRTQKDGNKYGTLALTVSINLSDIDTSKQITQGRGLSKKTATFIERSNGSIHVKTKSKFDTKKPLNWNGKIIKTRFRQRWKGPRNDPDRPETRYRWEKLLQLECAIKLKSDDFEERDVENVVVSRDFEKFEAKDNVYNDMAHLWWGMSRHSNRCGMVNVHLLTDKHTTASKYAGRKRSCERLPGCKWNDPDKCSSDSLDVEFLISPQDVVNVIRATRNSFNYFIEGSGIANMNAVPCNDVAHAAKDVCKGDDLCQWEIHSKTTGKCRNTEIQDAKKELNTRKMHKVNCR